MSNQVKEMKIWFRDSDQPIEFVLPDICYNPVSYLNELKEKPLVTVPSFVDEKETYYQTVKSILIGNLSADTPSDLAVGFIYWNLSQLTGTLDSDWKSYDITIGTKGQNITPMDLFRFAKQPAEVKGTSPSLEQKPMDLGVLAKCLIVYRLARTDQPAFRSQLLSRLSRLFKMPPFSLDVTPGVTNVLHWINDRAYCALVAGIEMFLRRFPRHPLGKLKECTQPSFLKDCAVLSSIDQAANALQVEPNVLFTYNSQPITAIAADVRRVLGGAPTEEKNKGHSYWQYMREMRLIPRSPYSANVNPNLFTWCNFIGVMSGNKKPMHAPLIFTVIPQLIFIDACYVVYYIHGNPKSEITQKNMQDAIDAESARGKREKMSPREILYIMRKNGFELTEEMKNNFATVVRSIDGSRQGTVGEFVKKYFEQSA